MTIVSGFDIDRIAEIVNLWTPIMLHMYNSLNHTFCEMSVHGISQCVGESVWTVKGSTYVNLW